MARFYANENFPLRVTKELRTLGHDVLTVFEAGNAGQRIPDDEVLSYATAQERAVLTLNRRDFMRLHLNGAKHAGIVVCTQDHDILRQAHQIHVLVLAYPTLQDKLIRVNKPSQ